MNEDDNVYKKRNRMQTKDPAIRRPRTVALLTSIIVLGTSAGLSLFADTDPTIPSASGATLSTPQDTPTTIVLVGSSNDSGSIIFATTTSPAHGTLGAITGSTVIYTPDSGYSGTDTFQFTTTEGATSSAPATISLSIIAPTPVGAVRFTVRDGSTIATSSTVYIPLSGTTSITATGGGTHDIPADSVLAALSTLDASSSEFAITDLSYDAGFASFLVNCIAVPAATSTPDCYDWHYVVNGTAPSVGMDHFDLHDGDSVYLYFGSPHLFTLSTSTVTVGSTISVTAQAYDPISGTYGPGTGLIVGAVTFNPDFSANEFATTTIDATGQGSFTLNATGTYQVGIKDDFYFPSQALTVSEATQGDTGGGGFSGGTDPHAQTTFDIPRALAYLAAQQKTDGSFANDYITDWAALAFANYPGSARDKLKSYLLTHTPTLSTVTDRERHAMALAALGINPFDGTPQDLIAPIVAAFDGTQVGDASLVTDDIFSLFPLLHGGYMQFDPMIRSIAKNIIAKQRPDGSWESSVDVTAAAMQALGPLFTVPGYGGALGKGAGYLASTEQADGGWNNPDSTSWVMTMVNSVREGDPSRAPVFVSATGKAPADALNLSQQSDGGVRPALDNTDTRTWSTAYAIVAASGKSWISLMQGFSGPSGSGTFSGGTDPYVGSATSTASTTPFAATSTPTVATSTSMLPPLAPSTIPASTTPTWLTDSGTSTRVSAPVISKKPKVKRVLIAPPTSQTQATTTSPRSQTAASASANTSFFGRIFDWVRSLLPW